MLPGIERMQWFRDNIWSQEARDEEDREKIEMDEKLEEIQNQPIELTGKGQSISEKPE